MEWDDRRRGDFQIFLTGFLLRSFSAKARVSEPERNGSLCTEVRVAQTRIGSLPGRFSGLGNFWRQQPFGAVIPDVHADYLAITHLESIQITITRETAAISPFAIKRSV